MDNLQELTLVVVFAPLIGAIIAGLFRDRIGRVGAHTFTITGVGLSFLLSLVIARMVFSQGQVSTHDLYTWASGGTFFPYHFVIGFLIDPLTSIMLLVVTFVSLLVHIYSIGYMADDDGYQRFFSYISFFTFAMLMLVTANNLLQLFFGWEGVGLASYLLIGFWYHRESANLGAMKAFLVNRVGDFGFLLGIAVALMYAGSISYASIFSQATQLASQVVTVIPGVPCSVATLMALLLFVGAMGKSAQMPLHVWLPESMEGPTPISALIHAATMVTAGVFMVARFSPIFEQSTTALSFVMIIGATGALFTGFIAIVMNDIKRVVAYSTLSQLGYMMAALGASAYSAGVFHLVTHACFKALLFLGAGSVIMAMHHEQDMRKMGGLWRYMPITYVTFVIGTLALCAVPPFAGFYSKDIIIEAVGESATWGARYAYICLTIGAFVTSVYSFRALFMTFHGTPRMDDHTKSHLHESPPVVWGPLAILAVPSIILGGLFVKPWLFSTPNILGSAITVAPEHDVLHHLAGEFPGALGMMLHAWASPTFWLVIAGFIISWLCYVRFPMLPDMIAERFAMIYRILMNKYGFDQFNDWFFVKGARAIGEFFSSSFDKRFIDGFFVNGSGMAVVWASLKGRFIQSGYLYHYATAMILGLLIFLSWVLLG